MYEATPILWFFALPLLVGSQLIRQTAVDPSEFPYQVLISECEEDPKCGGAVISNGFLITSATCVLEFGGIQKFLQDAVLYGGGASLLFNIGEVADASIHPKYMVDPTTYDVAIVKYIPADKGPKLNSTTLNGTWDDPQGCVFSSWWSEPESRLPVRLTWQPVSLSECSPYDPNSICFADDTTEFFKNDYGSPIVCENVLMGIVPRNGGKKAVNLTADYNWITTTITELSVTVVETGDGAAEGNQLYLLQILQKLDVLQREQESSTSDNLTHWNNQIVVPLSYVLFSLVIFFFVLLFFLVLFTVVLVYYSRK
ncbi:inactive serine protease scarface-like [Macrosteles quadrilineatus]|uniref:inactive serine protease scarface-like n=1 Tax=Macrosteles quadrilineatus TaxID=74068 RepID=UPI0023E29053|nr:inactive serine protease scarface-like [Macrosteles quadrilineatus]